MTETMVEKVARAIYETEPYQVSMRSEMPWADVHESQKEGFRVKAKAAIEAMRGARPTDAMVDRFDADHCHMTTYHCISEAWEALINEALKDG